MSWKLICDRGRQIWQWICSETSPSIEYDPTNENSSDRIFREEFYQKNFQKLKVNIDETKEDASLLLNQRIFDAINYFQSLQSDDGHWPGDYGGPMFLLPGAIFTSYVTKFQFKDEEKSEMIRYLFHHQLDDGGWGTHIQSSSTMFGTVLNYISLRILGIPSNDHRMIKASDLIKREGGAMYAPSWAKFWLCVLGLIPWNGINCLLPELWLLPVWLPFHPSRYWCHARMVYLSMSYIYSEKIVAHSSSLIEDLKKELFIEENYQQIDFSQHRNSISPLDLYSPQTHLLKLIHRFLNFYEMIHLKSFRVKSSEYLFQLIRGEDEHTDYIDIGPVNKFLNMISIYHHDGREGETFAKHLHRVQDYLWLSEDGMKLQGYNGSQLWDTAFTIQSIIETGFDHYFSRSLQLASNYLEMSQVLEDVHQYQWYFRHPSRGGWPFSTRDHGWPITDCTAEAIKAVLLLKEKNHLQDDLIHQERIEWGIDFILSCQNKDGGWATYELQRTSKYLEWLNPSEVFYGIMIDYSYVECTSACVQALNRFRSSSNYRRREIDLSIERGLNFIRKQQRKDGSWYGSWAICFTYGTWFAIEALITLGESPQSPTIQKAIQFLLSKQNADGGWGESYLSCVHKCYVPHQQSQIVNTSWALLTLIQAQADPIAIEKGIEYLLRQQSSNGDWIQQSISGVFNGNCMISYTNYRNIFPIWALGRYRTVFLKKK